jgi:hypothetical protein
VRRKDLCTACREPLGESRLVVHDASGRLTGEFHTKDCLSDYALAVDSEYNTGKFIDEGTRWAAKP